MRRELSKRTGWLLTIVGGLLMWYVAARLAIWAARVIVSTIGS